MSSITSLNQLDEFFADMVVSLIGLESDKVLIAYEQMGQVFPNKFMDVCFVHTSEETDDVQMYKTRKEGPIKVQGEDKWKIEQYSMRRIKVQFIFYGPNSNAKAMELKEKLYFPGTNLLLDTNNLALIPTGINLTNIRENINDIYWERTDLEASFYNSVIFDEVVDMIESMNLTVKTQ